MRGREGGAEGRVALVIGEREGNTTHLFLKGPWEWDKETASELWFSDSSKHYQVRLEKGNRDKEGVENSSPCKLRRKM